MNMRATATNDVRPADPFAVVMGKERGGDDSIYAMIEWSVSVDDLDKLKAYLISVDGPGAVAPRGRSGIDDVQTLEQDPALLAFQAAFSRKAPGVEVLRIDNCGPQLGAGNYMLDIYVKVTDRESLAAFAKEHAEGWDYPYSPEICAIIATGLLTANELEVGQHEMGLLFSCHEQDVYLMENGQTERPDTNLPNLLTYVDANGNPMTAQKLEELLRAQQA